jgi:hypothetical protein
LKLEITSAGFAGGLDTSIEAAYSAPVSSRELLSAGRIITASNPSLDQPDPGERAKQVTCGTNVMSLTKCRHDEQRGEFRLVLYSHRWSPRC